MILNECQPSIVFCLIQGEADKQPDSELQRRLLAAAKVLAEATARMVEAARQCASHPHDTARQQHLRHTVEELRAATTLAATPALRKTLVNRLEVSIGWANCLENLLLAPKNIMCFHFHYCQNLSLPWPISL